MKLKPFLTSFTEAGCDEAGRGCLAGPVVAAAVILPKGYKNIKLDDSKKISEKNRNDLRIDIEKNAIAIGITKGLAINENSDLPWEYNVKNTSERVVKVIQSYTSIVNKVIWNK